MLRIIRAAEHMAAKSPLRYKHACIITSSSGKLLSTGVNRPGRRGNSPTHHAEYNAFQGLKYCFQEE